tara:strand:- start:8435 stop:10009 length:1575 start_codon:yes stop_codon:yes gene_type:complete
MPIIKTIEVEVNAGKAEKDLKGLDKGLQKVDKSVEDIGDTSKETQKEMGAFGTAIDKVTGGGYTGFIKMTKAIRTGNVSLKAMKVAFIATGIGAFVVLVGSLAANFGNSEEGANKLNKVLDKIKVVVGNVTDIFYNLSQSLVSFLSRDFDKAAKQFEEATNKIKNFRKETEREVKVAGQLADKKAELLEIERKLTVDRAEADRKRADLLDKAANREEYTALQRIEFLKEAGAIEQTITDEEIKAAQIRLFIKQEENKASVSGTEDLNAEAELKAELIRLDTARLTKQKEITSQIQGAKGEETARLQGLANARQTEIDNFQAHRDTLDKILIKSVGKQEQATIKTGDITSDLKKRAAKDEIKTDKLTSDQKLSVASDTLGNLAGLLGESSSAGKAAAIAQTTIETYKGAQSAFSSLAGIPVVGPVLGGIAAAAAIASGIATVKQITSVKTPGGKGGGSSSISAPRRATVPSAPPSFNVVGASETNQLAQAIGQDEKQPIKAFVVSNDVSDAQSLDRNIIESASIG